MRRAIAGSVTALLLWGAAATPASAHADVEGTQPRNGAHLATAPAAVRVTFGEDVSLTAARLVGPSGAEIPSSATVSGATVTITPTAALSPGAVTAAWQVRSDDGHPVAGSMAFIIGPKPRTGPPQTLDPFPRIPARLSGSRPGSLVLTLATSGLGGDVQWTSAAIAEPQTWHLAVDRGSLVARGVLPQPGTWTYSATVLKKGGAAIVVKGTATLTAGAR
jgi:methionine-rich copper-binding protein CopC